MSNILVVDDDYIHLALLEAFLSGFSGEGHNFTFVATFDEARDILHTKQIDLLVTDYLLDIDTGLTLCHEAKTTSSAKTILLSASELDEERDVDFFFLKPIRKSLFLEYINILLQNSPQ